MGGNSTFSRYVIERNIAEDIEPNNNKVVAAFLLFGFLNAGTPFEIASTPVRAVQPEEKALANKNTKAKPVTLCSAVIVQSALSAFNCTP